MGIAFNAPPPHLLTDAIAAVDFITGTLPPEAKGAVIGVMTDTGWNAAVVHRAGDRFQVGAWIGKPSGWGTRIDGGGFVKAQW